MPIVETDRLLLQRLTPDDAEFILELVNEPAWLQFIGDRGVHDLDEARAYIASGATAMYERHGFGPYVIIRKADGVKLGLCGIFRRDYLPDADLGFALLTRFSGFGYAREAALATVAHAYNDLGLKRIVAITNPANRPSVRLLESIGFASEGMVELEGRPAPVNLFSLPGRR